MKKRNPQLVKYYELNEDEELEGYMNPDEIDTYINKYINVQKIPYKDESQDPYMIEYAKELPVELKDVLPDKI